MFILHIYYQELAYLVIEADKSQDLQVGDLREMKVLRLRKTPCFSSSPKSGKDQRP